jgi:hypothetical protein
MHGNGVPQVLLHCLRRSPVLGAGQLAVCHTAGCSCGMSTLQRCACQSLTCSSKCCLKVGWARQGACYLQDAGHE